MTDLPKQYAWLETEPGPRILVEALKTYGTIEKPGEGSNPSILAWADYRDKVLIPFQLKRYDALGLWYWSKDKPDLLKTLPDETKTLN